MKAPEKHHAIKGSYEWGGQVGGRVGVALNGRHAFALALILGFAFSAPLRAATRTQGIPLRAGWNAVFLEVHPSSVEPVAVFANTPVDIVASYESRQSPAQFMSNPSADLLKLAGWGVWYADHRPDALLTTLHAMEGQRAYLVHSTSDYLWQVTGDVGPPRVHWQPNSVSALPGTFAQFFSGSRAHHHNRIYRLVNGSWRRVSDASSETMRSGEAFWIYCDGKSDYQGPLRVETGSSVGLVLGSGADALVLRNETDHPVTPTVEHVVSGADPVPLSILVTAIQSSNSVVRSVSVALADGNWTQALPPIEGGRGLQVPLEARLEAMRAPRQTSLLRVSTDVGTEVWIPIAAHRRDLEEK